VITSRDVLDKAEDYAATVAYGLIEEALTAFGADTDASASYSDQKETTRKLLLAALELIR
jgi:hypothetical protein